MASKVPLFKDDMVVAPDEIQLFQRIDKSSGQRGQMSIVPEAGIEFGQGKSQEISITIPDLGEVMVNPADTYLQFKVVMAEHDRMHSGASSLFDSCQVYSGSGELLSDIRNYAELNSLLTDVSVGRELRDNAWTTGYSGDLKTNNTYQMHLVGTILSQDTFVWTKLFGGLRIVLRVRDAWDVVSRKAGETGTPSSLTIKDVKLQLATYKPDSDTIQQIAKTLKDGQKARYYYDSYQCHVFNVAPQTTEGVLSIPNRNKSQKAVLGCAYSTVARSEQHPPIDATYADSDSLIPYVWYTNGATRSHFDRASMSLTELQLRQGDVAIPASPARSRAEMYSLLSSAMGKSHLGMLTSQVYAKDSEYDADKKHTGVAKRFAFGFPLSVTQGQSDGGSTLGGSEGQNLDIYYKKAIPPNEPPYTVMTWVRHSVVVECGTDGIQVVR